MRRILCTFTFVIAAAFLDMSRLIYPNMYATLMVGLIKKIADDAGFVLVEKFAVTNTEQSCYNVCEYLKP